MSHDSPLRTNYSFLSVGGEQRDEDGEGDTELQSQFVKCRRGIRLFRDVSDQSRSSENIRELVHPTKETEDVYNNVHDHEQNLSDIVKTMAITRMEDQRCSLGGHHNPALLHSQSREEEERVRSYCPFHSFLFSPFTNNPQMDREEIKDSLCQLYGCTFLFSLISNLFDTLTGSTIPAIKFVDFFKEISRETSAPFAH